jgi:hypothetical protein
MMTPYASLTDLLAWMGLADATTLPLPATTNTATRQLRESSARVQHITRFALYAIDDNDFPTDLELLKVFTSATCADAEAFIVSGILPGQIAVNSNDGATLKMIPGARIQYLGAQIAVKAKDALINGDIAPAAARILDNAGLMSGQPTSVWAYGFLGLGPQPI